MVVPSRQLPSITLPPHEMTGVGPFHIRVTEHNYIKPTNSLKGTRLEYTPLYAFWGVPEHSYLNHFPVRYLGLGFLTPGGTSAVEAAGALTHAH